MRHIYVGFEGAWYDGPDAESKGASEASRGNAGLLCLKRIYRDRAGYVRRTGDQGGGVVVRTLSRAGFKRRGEPE